MEDGGHEDVLFTVSLFQLVDLEFFLAGLDGEVVVDLALVDVRGEDEQHLAVVDLVVADEGLLESGLLVLFPDQLVVVAVHEVHQGGPRLVFAVAEVQGDAVQPI